MTNISKWIDAEYKKAMRISKYPYLNHTKALDAFTRYRTIHFIINEKHKTVIMINMKTGKSAISKCNSKDNWNERVGIAIACAKYCNDKIPESMYQNYISF